MPQCGPRAWYGRFICKAFGIPTWGVRQPGHAAMTRWTSSGWDVCLGGGMWKSWWNDQGGLDFVLETQARAACPDELTFLQKVYRLQWFAQYHCNETTDVVRRNGQYDPKNPWYTLSMIQRQNIVKNSKSTKKLMFPPILDGKNQLERMSIHKTIDARKDIWYDDNNGVIVIPAASCLVNKKTMTLPSFSGGQQLFVPDDAEVVYQMDWNALAQWHPAYVVHQQTATLVYSMTCRVATAHRSEQSITLTVNDTCSYTIEMPYTMGLWGVTAPIQIALDKTDGPTVTLKFRRPLQKFGFAFQDFQLSPVE
jgi:hypothetical protein